MQDASTHTADLRIASAHPSLPGHFPGNPIVPGVVLLDHVQQAAREWLGPATQLRAIPQAKFVQPLLPEQDALIQLRLTGSELRFTILRGDSVLAQGVMTLAIEATSKSEPTA
ncbi:MAG: hydroxymyristoyl-ACP dehydratase [Povalibacter sp.]